MSLAVLSLGALVIAITVSCVSQVNVGFLAIVLAWIVGVYLGGMSLGELFGGFPSQLFLTLVGVTLLFSQAGVNGTLDRITQHAVRLCRGHRGVLPIMFFLLSLVLASIGPGNIAATALVAPLAMGVAGEVGIPAFLMAIMVGHGASAGALSPFAPTGIIVNGIMANAGMADFEAQNYFNNMIAHTTVAFGGYFLFGGMRLFRDEKAAATVATVSPRIGVPEPFQGAHYLTVAVIAALIVGVIFFDLNVGMTGLAGAVVLTLLKVGDEKRAVREMPWRVIMLVSGVTVLVSLLQETGGMDLFSAMLARLSTPLTVTGVTAFFAGVISIYSSTSGVVLPALLPTVPGLVERLGGGEGLALAISSSMNVGGHLVDVSPISTIGALCIACASASEDSRALFNKLLAWGVSMSIVGALVCWLFFGVL